jgi:hypothetical protein
MAIEQQSPTSTHRALVVRFGYGLLIGAGPVLLFGLGIVSLAIADPAAALAFALLMLLSGALMYVVSAILALPLLAIPSTRVTAAGLIVGLVVSSAAVTLFVTRVDWSGFFG